MRVSVNPNLFIWAQERAVRAGLDEEKLFRAFPELNEWREGAADPTLRQLESFAEKTYVPLGQFFLQEPPQEELPIDDFRTLSDLPVVDPNPNLLETIYQCQYRQDWYRNYLQQQGADAVDFVGCVSLQSDTVDVAHQIRQRIQLNPTDHRRLKTRAEALRSLAEKIEDQGILVMMSGVVGNNSSRRLDCGEFRGFALHDSLAPVIFVNSKDSEAAQIFTLAHELAHIWLGKSGVSNILPDDIRQGSEVERWCNRVAAETLVPQKDIKQDYQADNPLPQEMQRLARLYKVSTLAILRRIYDIQGINRETYWQSYHKEKQRLEAVKPKATQKPGGGGDFYRTLGIRVSKRFIRALVPHTLGGQTLFRDAFKDAGY